jgi:hypothetical protein
MSRPKLSVPDLVRHAAMEFRCQWTERYGTDFGPSATRAGLEDALADLLESVERGDSAPRLRDPSPYPFSDPLLDAFLEKCELAHRIDCLLALPMPGVGAALAASCRNDLGALAVLADWLLDNGQPRAAEEARHLFGVVQSLPGEPVTGSAGQPPDWWVRGLSEDYSEGDYYEEMME